ncbi:HipA family kinase, partial [Chromobacterium haemolyticum]|uniref:HipA family kinase n=1 Tax=Chromobacterium haemolyticum TaxID=394935 RepID=UPI001EE690A7
MLDSLQVIEILYQSTQGMSGPYICRADDGQNYYIKGQRPAGRRSQTCELLAWFLGHSFGLPLPPAAMLEMSDELYEELPRELSGIGRGMLFGLQECQSMRWFEPADVYRTSKEFRRELLVFDYWISNEDRIPFNSNLLYSDTEKRVVVIDHNRAFIEHISRHELVGGHIFSEEWPGVCSDLVFRAQYSERI